MFTVSKLNKSVLLSAIASLVLAGCGGGDSSSSQDDLNLSNDTPVAFVTKSAASESQANLAQLEQTFQGKTRVPLAASSPYRVNFGAKLNLKTSLDIDSQLYSAILDEYFGSEDYDVKDLHTSADGKTLIFAAHGPETSLTDNSWNIYRMDFDTMTVSRIIKDDVLANSGQDTNPTFTADSKRIIFSTDRAAGNPNSPIVNIIDEEPGEDCHKVETTEKPSLLHSMKLDGSEILQLTYGNNHDVSPVTMNDGRISFIRVWQSFVSVAQQCAAGQQKPSTSPIAAGNLFGASAAPGLDKPDSWSENAVCRFAIDTPVGAVVANNHYTILRITQDGSEMEQLYNTVTVGNSDEAFLHLTDLTQAENGKLVAILQHQFNRYLGGMPVELQSPQSGSDSSVFGNFAPKSIIDAELQVYPNQVSQGGLFSSLETYRDGSERKLMSWSKCTTIDDRNISAFCDSNSSVEDLDNRYALWVLDQGEMLPITRSEKDRVFTDITISQPHENADFPYQAYNANFEDNLDTSRIVCKVPPVFVTPTPVVPPVETPVVPPVETPVVPPVETPVVPPVETPVVPPVETPVVPPVETPVVPPVETPVVPPVETPVVPPVETPVVPPVETPVVPPVETPVVPPVETPGITPPPVATPGVTPPPEPVNTAPVADAGADIVTRVGLLEILNGSNSRDADGDALTYKWSVTSGQGLSLSMSEFETATVVATARGAFTVQLIVNDGQVDSAPDTVRVMVENTPPVADAGANQAAFLGDRLILDGSNSGDADGDELSFAWKVIKGGSGIRLSNASSDKPNVEVLRNGTYQIELIVNDGDLDSAADIVTISAGNELPVAKAGNDQKVEKDTRVDLDGSASFDPEGESLTYTWSVVETPENATANLTDMTSVRPSFVPSVAGTYVLRLVVNDGVLDSEADTVAVTVLKTPDEVVFDCDTLPRQSTQLDISFPSTKKRTSYPGQCTWDHIENPRANNIQGFNIQTSTPSLPKNAVICSSKISTRGVGDMTWIYDDEFFLTVGDQIIVSSEKKSVFDKLKVDDQYIWNFSAIKGEYYRSSNDRYCLGENEDSACEFPRTQREGRFNIEIASEDFAQVSANIINDGVAEFKLIITGDNNPEIDCQHSGIDLSWDVEYVIPN